MTEIITGSNALHWLSKEADRNLTTPKKIIDCSQCGDSFELRGIPKFSLYGQETKPEFKDEDKCERCRR